VATERIFKLTRNLRSIDRLGSSSRRTNTGKRRSLATTSGILLGEGSSPRLLPEPRPGSRSSERI
jgi:hypothetical protein